MLLLLFPLHPTHQLDKTNLNNLFIYFLCWVDFFSCFEPWHILLLQIICVLIAWKNNNEIKLTKFTKVNFFVDWWVRLGWIFLFVCFVFILDIYYFCIWYVFWLHEKRKMKSTWQNLLNSIFLWINTGLSWVDIYIYIYIYIFSLDIYYFVFWLHDRKKMKHWLIFYSYPPISEYIYKHFLHFSL